MFAFEAIRDGSMDGQTNGRACSLAVLCPTLPLPLAGSARFVVEKILCALRSAERAECAGEVDWTGLDWTGLEKSGGKGARGRWHVTVHPSMNRLLIDECA